MRYNWIVLTSSFFLMIYLLNGLSSFDEDVTVIQILLTLAGIGCGLLMIFQSVKNILLANETK